MPSITNAEIWGKLGELSGIMQGVQRDLASASEGRKSLYEKIEEQNDHIRNVQFETEKQTSINGQVRDAILELNKAQTETSKNIKPLLDLKDELPPLVEAWKDLRKTSQRLVWLLGLGGVTVGGVLIFAGNTLFEAFRHLLGLPK